MYSRFFHLVNQINNGVYDTCDEAAASLLDLMTDDEYLCYTPKPNTLTYTIRLDKQSFTMSGFGDYPRVGGNTATSSTARNAIFLYNFPVLWVGRRRSTLSSGRLIVSHHSLRMVSRCKCFREKQLD